MPPVEEAEQVVKKRKALDGAMVPDPDAFAALAPVSPVSKKGRVRSEGKYPDLLWPSDFFASIRSLNFFLVCVIAML